MLQACRRAGVQARVVQRCWIQPDMSTLRLNNVGRALNVKPIHICEAVERCVVVNLVGD
jgi:hypothetical protein